MGAHHGVNCRKERNGVLFGQAFLNDCFSGACVHGNTLNAGLVCDFVHCYGCFVGLGLFFLGDDSQRGFRGHNYALLCHVGFIISQLEVC